MEVDISPLKAVSWLRDDFLRDDLQIEEDDTQIEGDGILATPNLLNDQQDGLCNGNNVVLDGDADDVDSDDGLDSDGDEDYFPDDVSDDYSARELSKFGEEFLSEYLLYLTSPSGAYREAASCKKEINRVRDMLSYLPIDNTLQPLVDRDMVESKIIHDFRMVPTKRGEAKSNSTMTTYVMYLINVLAYIITEDLYDHVGVTSNAVNAMKAKLTHTRKNFFNASKKDSRVREDKETDHINENLSVEKVKQYNEYATGRALELFRKYVPPNVADTVNKHDYTAMRDYLIVGLSMKIAQRDGVYTNLRHSEVDDATKKGGVWIVKVKDHKGAKEHGAARIALDEESMSRLLVFANIVRPMMEPMFEQLKKQNKEKESHELTRYVFAPWPKKGGHGHMQSGSASRVLSRRFLEAECIDKNTRICNNQMRKVGVAAIELAYPGDGSLRRKLAKSMTHMISTSVKHYERFNRDADDAEIQKILGNVFGIPSTVDSEDTRVSAEPIVTASTVDSEDTRVSAEQIVTASTVDSEDTRVSAEPIVTAVCTPRRSYSKWKVEDDAEMEKVVSSSPSEQLRTSVGILNITPTRLKETYGDERCIQKCRRILSPKMEVVNSVLPRHLQLQRSRKSTALSMEDENALYLTCKEQIELTAAGNIPKKEKVTSKGYLKNLLKPTGFGDDDKYDFNQIHTKVSNWVTREQAKQGKERSDQNSACRDGAK